MKCATGRIRVGRRCRDAWQGRFAGGALAGALALHGAGVVHPARASGS